MKALVINLDRNPERWEHVQAAMNGVPADVERISAVDGRLLTDKWHYLSRWMHLTHEPDKFNILPAIGCFLSHRKCWQYVVDNDLPHALVLEDDVKPTPFTAPFLEAFEANPPPFDWLKLHVHRRIKRTRQELLDIELADVRLCVDMAGSKSNAAYIITNQGAHKSLGYSKLLAPIDHLEWLHLGHSLVFAQTSENVIEIDESLPSTITAEALGQISRLPAIARIGLVRKTLGKALGHSNKKAAIALARQYSMSKAR